MPAWLSESRDKLGEPRRIIQGRITLRERKRLSKRPAGGVQTDCDGSEPEADGGFPPPGFPGSTTTCWISNFQEILDQLLPIGSKHAFRMELNPFYRQSSVAQAHDDIRAIPLMRAGADFQIAWYSLLRDNQRVITRGGHWCV